MDESNQVEDEALLARIQEGDRSAFGVLVRRHTDRFFGLAYRLTNDREAAQDVVQDAFLALWEKPHQWRADRGAKFTTWFYRVIVNRCANTRRATKQLVPIEESGAMIASAASTQDQLLVQAERQQALEREIHALPERQRVALELCFYEGLSNQEAADVLGVRLKALQSLVMRAKTRLRARLAKFL